MTNRSNVQKRMKEADEAVKGLFIIAVKTFLETVSEKMEDLCLYTDSEYRVLRQDVEQVVLEMRQGGFAFQDGMVMVPCHWYEKAELFSGKERFRERLEAEKNLSDSSPIYQEMIEELQEMTWKTNYLSWMIKMTGKVIEKADCEQSADRERCYGCFRFLLYLTEYELFSDEGVMGKIDDLQMMWPYPYVLELVG